MVRDRHAVIRSTLLAFAIGIASGPAFACSGAPLFELMDKPLPSTPDVTFDVDEIESTDGGDWQIWFGEDGRMVQTLERRDYGEGGRWAARLIVLSPAAYAVTTTSFIYSAPYYVSGSTTVREEKDIFIFCDGSLLLPEDVFALDSEYAGKAAAALAIFDAAEVAEYLPALER